MEMLKLHHLFSNRSVAIKLATMTIVGAICMVLVAATVLLVARSQLVTERTEKAHAIVDAVWQMADSFQHAAASGQMTEEEAKKQFFAAAAAVWYEGHTNYVFIYDTETGICLANSGIPPLVGKDMRPMKDANGLPFAAMLIDIAKNGEGSLRYAFRRSANDVTPLDKVAYARGFAPWKLMIGTAEYMSDVDASFWSMVRTASAVIALLMLCSIAIAWAITRSVVKPLTNLKDQFESEVGEIIGMVSAAASQLEASSGTLSKTAESVEQVSHRASNASGQASANVHSVAAASEELASSVGEISRQVEASARIAGEAVEQAQKTDVRISQLSQAASRIGDVVDLIQTIAGQTNLLALNATIEAARAGEAGRGFAVVASEVKTLAEQTAKATGEISQQIADIQSATKDSVTAIKEIGATIGRISEISSTIASAVEEQGAATQEISRNVQRAAEGTTQVAGDISDVQRGASETGAASSQVLSAAQSLSRESERLKQGVGRFMASVRAA
jgi:methyl-accepting chemotaxis protein